MLFPYVIQPLHRGTHPDLVPAQVTTHLLTILHENRSPPCSFGIDCLNEHPVVWTKPSNSQCRCYCQFLLHSVHGLLLFHAHTNSTFLRCGLQEGEATKENLCNHIVYYVETPKETQNSIRLLYTGHFTSFSTFRMSESLSPSVHMTPTILISGMYHDDFRAATVADTLNSLAGRGQGCLYTL